MSFEYLKQIREHVMRELVRTLKIVLRAISVLFKWKIRYTYAKS